MVFWHQAKLKASRVSNASKQHSTPQPYNSKAKFNSILVTFDSPALLPSNDDFNTIAQLVDDRSLTFDDKLIRTLAFHANRLHLFIQSSSFDKQMP